jgi:hypothetical protein
MDEMLKEADAVSSDKGYGWVGTLVGLLAAALRSSREREAAWKKMEEAGWVAIRHDHYATEREDYRRLLAAANTLTSQRDEARAALSSLREKVLRLYGADPATSRAVLALIDDARGTQEKRDA